MSLFITFEGGEGAGKTTLIDEIAKKLSPVVRTREPGGTKFGEHVRNLLLNTDMTPYAELCLFLASRAQQITEIIGPALQQGKVVLCDRFNDSSIAYQGAARGLGMQKVADMCDFICQGLEPSLTFYLDIDPTLGLARAKKTRSQDRIEAEEIAFHEKIREAYHILHRQHPQRLHLLDATKTPNEVFEEAMSIINERISKKSPR